MARSEVRLNHGGLGYSLAMTDLTNGVIILALCSNQSQFSSISRYRQARKDDSCFFHSMSVDHGNSRRYAMIYLRTRPTTIIDYGQNSANHHQLPPRRFGWRRCSHRQTDRFYRELRLSIPRNRAQFFQADHLNIQLLFFSGDATLAVGRRPGAYITSISQG